jgi:IclR family pca regulon transcriptional regulator
MRSRPSAQPILERMSAAFHESFSVATLDGDDIVYIARTTVSRVMAVDLHIGSRLPAYCTSMGRVLLAYQPADQLEAYLARVVLTPTPPAPSPPSTSSDAPPQRPPQRLRPLRPGTRSRSPLLAVPVFAPSGRVVATLNLSGSAPRMPVYDMQTKFPSAPPQRRQRTRRSPPLNSAVFSFRARL